MLQFTVDETKQWVSWFTCICTIRRTWYWHWEGGSKRQSGASGLTSSSRQNNTDTDASVRVSVTGCPSAQKSLFWRASPSRAVLPVWASGARAAPWVCLLNIWVVLFIINQPCEQICISDGQWSGIFGINLLTLLETVWVCANHLCYTLKGRRELHEKKEKVWGLTLFLLSKALFECWGFDFF